MLRGEAGQDVGSIVTTQVNNNYHFGENTGGGLGSRTLSRENSNEAHSNEGAAVVLT